MKYEIREITPKNMECVNVACPAIYEGIKDITPKNMACTISACPSSYEAKRKGKEVYLIVGKSVNPADVGLEGKVGEGDSLIEVPRGLIDGIRK